MKSLNIIHGNCLEEMPKLEAGSVNAIIADLPYGTTACAWDAVIPFEPMWREFKRLLVPNGVVVLTASQPFTSTLVMSNPRWFRCEWIWHKSNGGGFLNANRQPLKRHESVLVFSPASHTYNPQMGKGNPYSCRRAAAGETTQDQSVAGWVTNNDGSRYPTTVLYFANDTGKHPTQKPVALMEYLVRTYTNPGELVLDPTMGSGTTGVTTLRCSRRFIGIEKERKYFEVARRRMSKIEVDLFEMAR